MIEICQICGAQYNVSHLRRDHKMTAKEYRKKYPKKKTVQHPWEEEGEAKPGPAKSKKKKPTPRRNPPATSALMKLVRSRAGGPNAETVLQFVETKMVGAEEEKAGLIQDLVNHVLKKDDKRMDALVAALALTSIQRLSRMANAVKIIEEELFKESRIRRASIAELVCMLQMIGKQQDKAIKHLERIYGDIHQDAPLVDGRTLVYVDGGNGNGKGLPAFLDSPEKRETIATGVSRVIDSLKAARQEAQGEA